MCTVSWVRRPGGYALFSNRDEKRTRSAGLGPRICERQGVRYVAPADPDFGGTWLAANELGVSVCLLNGVARAMQQPIRSRGLLVRELAGAHSGTDCLRWLERLELDSYAGFLLLVLDLMGTEMLAEWDGRVLSVDPAASSDVPLTSSSYDPVGVGRARRNEFARQLGASGRVDAAFLEGFHRSHGPGPGCYSPCMHRSDAETVSFSRVMVGPESIHMVYSPEAPCRRRPGVAVRLARAR